MTSDYHVLLRAVAHSVTGADVLYVGADLLERGRNADERAHNRALLIMVARLLGLPETDPAVIENVLRTLPPQEMKEIYR